MTGEEMTRQNNRYEPMRQDNYRGFEDEADGCAVCLPCQTRPLRPTTAQNVSTLFGIDVSHHQGTIDWKKVKAAGVQFVFLKATEGETYVDNLYASNRAGAKAVGIPCGAYHFFRPKASLTAQIDNFVKTVGKLQPGDLPPVLDIEVPADWKDIAIKVRVQMILDWLSAVEKKLGVKPLIYINNPMARDELASAAALGNYKLWLAHYTDRPAPRVPAPWAGWTFWQYSELGVVDGVPSQSCDMNRFAGTNADLQRLLVPAKGGRIRRKFISVLSRILRV